MEKFFKSNAEGLMIFLKDALILLSVLIFSKGIRYISSIIILRNLSLVDYGFYAYFLQLAGYLGVLIEVGLPMSIIILHVRKRIALNEIFFVIGIYFFIVFLLLIAFSLVAYPLFFNRLFSEIGPIKIIYIAVYGSLIFLGNILTASIRAKGKNNQYSQLIFLLGLFSLLATLGALQFTDFRFIDVLNALIIGTLIWVLIVCFLNKDLFNFNKLSDLSSVKIIFSVGFKNYITRLISSFIYLFPFLFIGYTNNPKALGYLGASTLIISAFRLIGQSLSLLLTAKLSSLSKENSLKFTIILAMGTLTLLCFSLFLISLIFEEVVEIIFGVKYLPAIILMKFCLVGVAFEILTSILTRSFVTNEFPKYNFQWLVYSSILLVLMAVFGFGDYSSFEEFLYLLGFGIAFSYFVGFLCSIFLLFLDNRFSQNKS